MKTTVIPFAQMSRREQREHLITMHGYTDADVEFVKDKLAASHTDDHRKYDGGPEITYPHAHTKVRRTKRAEVYKSRDA